MKNKIPNIRIDYNKNIITKEELNIDPMKQFNKWFDIALNSNISDANSTVLSTVSSRGIPSGRVVLLKNVDSLGFTFFSKSYFNSISRFLDDNLTRSSKDKIFSRLSFSVS